MEFDTSSNAELEARALQIVEDSAEEELEVVADDDEIAQAQPAEGDGGPQETEATPEDEDVDPGQVIDAPKSWKAEAKELFSQLSPELQRQVAERDEEQSRAFSRKVNEVTEARRRAEQEVNQITQERKKYAESLDFLVKQSQTHDPIIEDARNTDWDKLSQENPAEFVQKRHRVEQHVAKIQQLQQEHERIQGERFSEAVAEQQRMLVRKVPELGDRKKFEDTSKRMRASLSDRYGFNAQELDQLADHRLYMLALDAVKYHDVMANQRSIVEKRQAQPAKVMKPAAQRPASNKNERFEQLKARAIRTGKDDDRVAAALAAIGA